MNLLLLAIRNLRRNWVRTILTVVGSAVAILAFVALRTVLSAWNAGVDYAAKDRIGTRHKVSFVLLLPRFYVDLIRQRPGVKAATWANWFGGKDPRDPKSFFASLAVDPESFLEVYPEISVKPEDKARWLEDKKGALVGAALAKKLKVKAGDRISLESGIFPGDWQFNISGIYQATSKSVDNSQFFFHWHYLNESMPKRAKDKVGWIISRIDEPGRSAEISAAIDKGFEERELPTLTMSERAMNLSFMGMISALLTAVNIVSIIILGIMVMILGNTIAMGVRERTQEYGVLRALGFLPKHLVTFIIAESAAVGLIGGMVGVGLAYPIVQYSMGRFLEENMGGFFPYFRIEPEVAGVALGLSLALGVIAALIPAAGAARLNVVDALRRVG